MKHCKARKDHVCSECGQKIAAGTTYWRQDSVEEFGAASKVHGNCLPHEKPVTAQVVER